MTENPDSQFARKRRVQQFNKAIELLRPSGLKILEDLGAGNTATKAAEMSGCRKSNITYWTKKLIAMGALRLQTKDVFKIYSLTPYGSTLLTRSEGVVDEPVVLEDCAVKFEILESEKGRLKWEKLGEPRNWVKLGVRIGSIRVVKTNRSVIIHPGPLRGFDVDELEVEAGRIVERVRGVLEGRFGMVLSERCVSLHKPIYRVYSEEAKKDVKFGTGIVEGPDGRQSSIDNSPPGPPHEEYDGKQRTIARQLLPDSVRSLQIQVDGLQKTMLQVLEALKPLQELPSILNKLTGGPEQPGSLSDSQQKMERYVT